MSSCGWATTENFSLECSVLNRKYLSSSIDVGMSGRELDFGIVNQERGVNSEPSARW